MESCPCGSENNYNECCEPFHLDKSSPETAETLMRARYSAFAKNQISFISRTHAPSTEKFDEDEAREWAINSNWKKLEIIKTEKGQAGDEKGIVEFKALYSDKENNDYSHHEISTFSKLDGKWYYDKGQIVGTGPLRRVTPKVGRNEPCSCGSGKKFKKCCG